MSAHNETSQLLNMEYVDFGGVSWVAQEHFYGNNFVLTLGVINSN